MRSQYVVRPDDSPGYHPANHSGTVNHRLVSSDTVGARQMEILHGTIAPGQGASLHAHPGIEQAAYVLEGEAEVEIGGGAMFRIGAGDCCFFPAGVMHVIRVVGQNPMKVLVIYAPPYCEDPAKVIRG